MTYQPVVIGDFGGLDLRSDPEQSACVDLLNVQLEQGFLRTREGYTGLIQPAALPGGRILRLGLHVTGSILFVDNNLDMNSMSGTTRNTVAASLTSNSFGYAKFGGTGGQRTYYGAGNTDTTFSRVSGDVAINASIANPGTTNTSGGGSVELGVTPNDNRLVWAFRDRVWFSDAGVPETFGATNYVDVDPGDGEYIKAVVNWRDLVFVFKESKFFIFYGTSTDSTGGPIFNYRKVLTRGVAQDGGGGACAGPDGVYFISNDGIYVTTGGEPSCISGDLDPLWYRGPLSPLYQGTVIGNLAASGGIAWAQGRLFVSVDTSVGGGTPTDMLVWTPGRGWSVWSVDAYSPIAREDNTTLVFAYASGDFQIGQFALSATTDAGAAIVSRYRSGFMDLGAPGVEKTVRETELTGIGSPSFAWSRDFGALDTATAVTLGTSPATARGRHRVAKRGSVLSWQISASSGAWRLNRVVPMLREQRPPGVRTS